ncbi:hemerythrin domain-containing protein [Pelagibacterium limicola]|uniref:hemerythrin domain-containing protein n=1 Tax=Pelagibacterium limicola TaxID=2791022 RepID=UPI0018AFC314|nr:hemerythrin domain-containing protein [Pelagibacterium limicola]
MTSPVAFKPAPDTGHLIDILNATHREMLALCQTLEMIADSLPADIDRTVCINAARILGPLIARAQDMEEEFIFPEIEKRWAMLPDMTKTIERLKYEHLEDICFSEELYDALMAYGRGVGQPAPDAFGYMLRGFFEGLRRHIAFEQDVIAPLLERGAPQPTRKLN